MPQRWTIPLRRERLLTRNLAMVTIILQLLRVWSHTCDSYRQPRPINKINKLSTSLLDLCWSCLRFWHHHTRLKLEFQTNVLNLRRQWNLGFRRKSIVLPCHSSTARGTSAITSRMVFAMISAGLGLAACNTILRTLNIKVCLLIYILLTSLKLC